MYNRYTPQSDGTYHRSRLPDQIKQSPARPEPPRQESSPLPCPPPEPPRRYAPPPRPRPRPSREQDGSIAGFLKQLLPKDFDTGDLLVVLLLLLMSGDCREDQNTALLTLALYLFL